MNKEELDKKIKEKAHVEAQVAIRKFKDVCCEEARKLIGEHINYFDGSFGENGRNVFALLASTNFNKEWPVSIWESREKKITNNILSTMNSLQRLFVEQEQNIKNPSTKKSEKEEVD